MTHTVKQFAAAAIFCLAGLFIFASCQKEVEAKTPFGKETYGFTEDESFSKRLQPLARQIATSPTVGGACTVTSGPNKGKKGTYTKDSDGSIWCSGTWGGTECGTGKCASASTAPPSNLPTKLPTRAPVVVRP